MSDYQKIVFRVDASTRIGSGHVMRCLTLAEELRDAGIKVVFISRSHEGNLNGLIQNKGFELYELSSGGQECTIDTIREEYAGWLGTTQDADAAETIEILKNNKPDWVIVDHYAIDECWEQLVRPYVKKIMVIDDLADRKHDCNLLLNPGIEPDLEDRYVKLVPAYTILMVGSQYCILRPEFDIEKSRQPADIIQWKRPRRVLVMFGGNDISGNTMEALEVLLNLMPSGIIVDVVVSAINQDQKRIRCFCEDHIGFTMHLSSTHVASLMVRADFAVGSGGGSTWERLYLRCPSILKIVAENQRKPLEYLAYVGLLQLYSTSEELGVALKSAFDNGLPIPADVVRNGVKTISKCILDKLVCLKMINCWDVRRTYLWLQDAQLRQNFLMRGDSPKISTHFQYWRQMLADSKQRIYSIYHGGRHIGNAGLRSFDVASGSAELWLYVGESMMRGRGIGRLVLGLLEDKIKNELCFGRALLHVSRKNRAAWRLYTAAGYKISETQDAHTLGFMPDQDVIKMEKWL